MLITDWKMASLQRRTWQSDLVADSSTPVLGFMCRGVTTVSMVFLFQTCHLNLMTRKHQQSPKWDPGSEVLVSISQVPRSWKTMKARELDPHES